jgi:hypothetical protein
MSTNVGRKKVGRDTPVSTLPGTEVVEMARAKKRKNPYLDKKYKEAA